MNLRLSLIACVLLVAGLQLPAQAAIPSNLPETRAVYMDLHQLKSECDRVIRMSADLRSAIGTLRSGVDDAITTTEAIRSLDRRMVKLIDRLKPYRSIPKVRTIARTLVTNLERVQEKLHSVRKKTDQCETEVLRPSRKRLDALRTTLAQGEYKLRQISLTAATWMANLDQAASIAQQVPAVRPILETSARASRPATRAAVGTVGEIEPMTDAVGRLINDVNRCFASYRVVRNSVQEANVKMKPGEEFAEKLDSVMGKKLTIRNPFNKKEVSFSVRDILEKPGEVIGIVLKPLEKMADKLLQPILSKANLEIKAPAGLNELSDQVSKIMQLDRDLNRAIADLQRQLERELDGHIRRVQAEAVKAIETVKSAASQSRPRDRREPVDSNPPPASKKEPEKRTSPVMFLSFG